MKKILLLTLLSILLHSCKVSERNDCWYQSWEKELENKVYKQGNNFRYLFCEDTDIRQRNKLIDDCNKYVMDNLRIINESEYKKLTNIIFVRDYDEMFKYVNEKLAGTIICAENTSTNQNFVFCLYEDGKATSLKHELMHIISYQKWGEVIGGTPLIWLSEGLAMYADPTIYCNENSFEKIYAVLMQNNKLLSTHSLIEDFRGGNPNNKDFDYVRILISYNQSAYIVQYMIDNYGIDKIKQLWQSGMDDFEKIFGLKFEDMTSEIEKELNRKYPNPIEFNWEKFYKRCD
ncbi:MAG: peptidase MA family metallohydrolase [Dysgonomonas sp.]|nr:peptidase MA family metallohydrolase [Dysgonomonas sp.]